MNVGFLVFAAVLLRIAACGMWYFLVAQDVPDVYKDRSPFIFRARHSFEVPGNTRPMTRHQVRENWNFHERIVRTLR